MARPRTDGLPTPITVTDIFLGAILDELREMKATLPQFQSPANVPDPNQLVLDMGKDSPPVVPEEAAVVTSTPEAQPDNPSRRKGKKA